MLCFHLNHILSNLIGKLNILCAFEVNLKEWLKAEMIDKAMSILFFSSHNVTNPEIGASELNIAIYNRRYSAGIHVYTFKGEGAIVHTPIWYS